MRKKEFLRRLGNRLSHLDRSERNDILDYYDELIEDSIDRTGKTEAEVIYDLGDLEDIVRRVDPSYKTKIRYEDEEDSRQSRRNYRQETSHQQRRKEHQSSSSRGAIGVILFICLFPLWIIVFTSLFALIVGVVCAGIGICAGGVVSIWHGITLFTTSSTMAIFQIGIGILGIGLILIVAPLILKIITLIGHLISKLFKWLFGNTSGRRRYAYEN